MVAPVPFSTLAIPFFACSTSIVEVFPSMHCIWSQNMIITNKQNNTARNNENIVKISVDGFLKSKQFFSRHMNPYPKISINACELPKNT